MSSLLTNPRTKVFGLRPNLTDSIKGLISLLLAAFLVCGLQPVVATAAAGSDTLAINETLGTNQSLWSHNRDYEARMQDDGNLVVYERGRATWSSNTKGSNPRLAMQGDSNLAMYSDQGVLFATGKARVGSNRLVMQDDGNLVLYGSNSVWASKNPSERAIQWFYDRRGRTDYEGSCEKAVENAFGRDFVYKWAASRPGLGRDLARSNWHQRQQQGPYSVAPRGALVFYNTSQDGHVAISLGNGQLVSTAVDGRIGVGSINRFASPYGWAWAPW